MGLLKIRGVGCHCVRSHLVQHSEQGRKNRLEKACFFFKPLFAKKFLGSNFEFTAFANLMPSTSLFIDLALEILSFLPYACDADDNDDGLRHIVRLSCAEKTLQKS
ncbi:MAG: hypothetical protein L6Q29_01275 [Candidatus Pacebacteria bacterium]|nr:hypothetical protein [Candidatus Paceibacterota bacterium]